MFRFIAISSDRLKGVSLTNVNTSFSLLWMGIETILPEFMVVLVVFDKFPAFQTFYMKFYCPGLRVAKVIQYNKNLPVGGL